jgi:four helix bundle protein
MQTHENLIVWGKSVQLSLSIYRITEDFPAREMHGLSSQMRRAAVSIASNIAEGRRRGTDADFRHFLQMAHGSLAELETQLFISKKLSFCKEKEFHAIKAQLTEVSKMLHGMIKKLA